MSYALDATLIHLMQPDKNTKIVDGFQLIFGKLMRDNPGADTEVVASTEADEKTLDGFRKIAFRYALPGQINSVAYQDGLVARFVPIKSTRGDEEWGLLARNMHQVDTMGRSYLATWVVFLSPAQLMRIDLTLAYFLSGQHIPAPKTNFQAHETLPLAKLPLPRAHLKPEHQRQKLKQVLDTMPHVDLFFEILRYLYSDSKSLLCFTHYERAVVQDICLALSFALPVPQRTMLSFVTVYVDQMRTSGGRVLFSKGQNQPAPPEAAIANWETGRLTNDATEASPRLLQKIRDLKSAYNTTGVDAIFAFIDAVAAGELEEKPASISSTEDSPTTFKPFSKPNVSAASTASSAEFRKPDSITSEFARLSFDDIPSTGVVALPGIQDGSVQETENLFPTKVSFGPSNTKAEPMAAVDMGISESTEHTSHDPIDELDKILRNLKSLAVSRDFIALQAKLQHLAEDEFDGDIKRVHADLTAERLEMLFNKVTRTFSLLDADHSEQFFDLWRNSHVRAEGDYKSWEFVASVWQDTQNDIFHELVREEIVAFDFKWQALAFSGLIVDDEFLIRELLQQAFASDGYQVDSLTFLAKVSELILNPLSQTTDDNMLKLTEIIFTTQHSAQVYQKTIIHHWLKLLYDTHYVDVKTLCEKIPNKRYHELQMSLKSGVDDDLRLLANRLQDALTS